MNLQRVMEVWNPDSKKAGTGYLITPHLVLTAYHNIQPRDSATLSQRFEVRRLGLGPTEHWDWMAGKVLWPEDPLDVDADPGSDGALLLITDDRWQPPDSAPVVWGRLGPPNVDRGRIDCVAVGFPQAEERDGHRDTKEIRGHIEALTGLKSGLISAHVDQVATPHGAMEISRWAGASGAALFCGTALVGVLTTDRAKDYPSTLLTAVPVAELAKRPGFSATVRATGNALAFREVIANSAHLVSQQSWQRHWELLRRAIDDPELAAVLEIGDGQVSSARQRQYLFADAYFTQILLRYREGDLSMNELVGHLRGMFEKPIMREYWYITHEQRARLGDAEDGRVYALADSLLQQLEDAETDEWWVIGDPPGDA